MTFMKLIKEHRSFRNMTILILIGWLFLVVLSVLLLLLDMDDRRHNEITNIVDHYTNVFDNYNKKIELLNAYYTDTSMNVDEDEFIQLIHELLAEDDTISYVSIAPNGIVQHVYPEAFADLIGTDIMLDANVYESTALLEAIDNNEIVYHFEAQDDEVQYIVIRCPIIVDDAYYGFLSIGIESDVFSQSSFSYTSDILDVVVYSEDNYYVSGTIFDLDVVDHQEIELDYVSLNVYEQFKTTFLFDRIGYVVGFVLSVSLIFYVVLLYHFKNALSNYMSQNELEYLRSHDDITGLFNIEKLFTDLRALISSNTSFFVCYINVNNLKVISEKLGYSETNQFLKTTLTLIDRVLRNNSILYRYGGDDFVLVCKEYTHSEVKNLMRRLTKIFDSDISSKNIRARLGITIGITSFPDNGKTAEQLINYANLTAQSIKNYDVDKFRFYHMGDIVDRTTIEEFDKRMAELDLELLEVFLMPIVDVHTNKIQGFECLTRVFDDLGNMMNTEDIILSLERTGRIQKLDEIVFRKMLSIMSRLTKEFQEEFFLSVNASALSLNDEYVEHIIEYYKNAKLPFGQIVLELTESYQVEDDDYLIELFHKLNKNGIKIAIDDFGSGYSSISYISKFPIYAIKVDKQYVRDYQTNAFNRTLLRTLKSIAEVLNCKLVAEGVDQADTLDFLRRSGCQFYQGFYFSKGVNLEETIKMIKENLEKYRG